MLPPICVNSWLSQSSRNGRLRKTSSAPGSSAPGPVALSDECDGLPVAHDVAGSDGGAQDGVSPADEPGDPALQRAALHQHVAVASLAA